MLPGGSGLPPFSRQPPGRQGIARFSPASRVSISELLGGPPIFRGFAERALLARPGWIRSRVQTRGHEVERACFESVIVPPVDLRGIK
jgi:hypothetical protein